MLLAHLSDDAVDRETLTRKFLRLAEIGNVPKTIKPGHHDGWGMALYREGSLTKWYRSKKSGVTDAKNAILLSNINKERPDTLLIHVRKMTVGEPAERNSHPFVDGRFAFTHNGMLGATDQEIFRDVNKHAVGETDTERYFHLIIHDLEMSDKHDPQCVTETFTRTVRALRIGVSYTGGSFTSASSILTDGKYAYVLREFSEDHPLVKQYAAGNYYTLYLGEGQNGSAYVCSEKLNISGVNWELLPNHSLTTIDFATGKHLTKSI